MKKTRILLADNDIVFATGVRFFLEKNGLAVVTATSGRSTQSIFKRALQNPFKLVVISTSLPGKTHLEVMNALRTQQKFVPIILLTRKVIQGELLAGFRAGADDYQPKSIAAEELLARIRVFLKRSKPVYLGQAKQYHLGNMVFDVDKRRLLSKAQAFEKKMSERETEILSYLATRKGKFVSKKELRLYVWGNDDYSVAGRTLDVHICSLRRKLDGQSTVAIEKIRGLGYILVVNRK